MDYIPNINDFERCPVCGKLFASSMLGEVVKHQHADIHLTDKEKEIRGKRVDHERRDQAKSL